MQKDKNSIDPDNTTDVVFKSPVYQALSPCKKKSGKKKTDTFDQQHNTVYAYYGQYAAPRETWVQFLNSGRTYDNEDEGEEYDPATRNIFVLKVFSIVFVLLLITAIFNVIVNVTPTLSHFFQSLNGKYLGLAACIGWILCSLSVVFIDAVFYPPLNYVLLIVALVCVSLLTACVTASTETTLVIYAIGATAVVVLLIMGLACTKWDFTVYWNFVMVGAMAISVVSFMIFIGMIITKTSFTPVVIAVTIIGTFAQSVVLILVLQAILGGKTVEFSEDLYVIAAYQVYGSIITIFLKLLRLIKEFSK